MVSKARDDFPLPERPVNTTSLFLGISISTFFRLCSLAPLITIFSFSKTKSSKQKAIIFILRLFFIKVNKILQVSVLLLLKKRLYCVRIIAVEGKFGAIPTRARRRDMQTILI